MNLQLLPILMPLIGAILCLLGRRSVPFQRWISGVVSISLPIFAFYLLLRVRADGVMALRLGNWPDAFGIVLTLDLFSALMIFIAAATQAMTWWFLVAGGAEKTAEQHLLYPIFLVLATGVNWAFSTGDLFNLFVGFEIVLLSSYILLSHGNQGPQIREAFKYVVLNIIASALFLAAAGYAYGVFGSLNMADLALRIARAGFPPEATILGTVLLVVFGIKAAVFPLYFWLPESYPKAPPGILAYFSGVLTKVGVYCLYRVFTLLFRDPAAMAEWFQPLILAIAGFTMLVGVLSALSQWTMRRILSTHIISQIGYMIFGLGLFTPLGIAAGIFYIAHQIVVKASLFLVADSVLLNEGSEELKKVGGVAAVYPGLALCFLFAALSLAGLPPLSGFYGKYSLVVEGVGEGHYLYVFVALLTSLFTLASMVKIWSYVFWRSREAGAPTHSKKPGVLLATGGLVSVSILIAIFSGWMMGVSIEAADQLLSREAYVQAVLGDEGVELLNAAMEKVRP